MASTDNTIVFDGSVNVVDAGVGNDTYILSPYVLAPGSTIQLSDADNKGSLQLVYRPGNIMAEAYATALRLTFDDGSVVTILDADKLTYEPGGNKVAGIDNADITYASFLRDIMGISGTLGDIPQFGGWLVVCGTLAPMITVPTGGNALTGAAGSVIGLPNLTFDDPENALITVSATTVKGGLVDLDATTAGVQASITGTEADVNAKFAGATFTGGVAGTPSTDTISITVSDGASTSIPARIDVTLTGATNVVNVPAGSTAPITLTSAAETINFDALVAQASTDNTQVILNGFAVADDRLVINSTTAAGNINLAQLDGVDDISVQANIITNETLINFGADANGDLETLTLAGITSTAPVNVTVI